MGLMVSSPTGNWYHLNEPLQLHDQVLDFPLVIERRDRFSMSFAELELVQMAFQDVFIVYGDMRLKQQQLRMRTVDMPDMVELHFSLSGKGIVENHINKKSYFFNPNQHNMMYVPEFDGTANYSKNEAYLFFELHFKSSYFLELVQNTGKTLEKFGEQIVLKKSANATEDYMPISLQMHRCLKDIMNCKFSGKLKFLFLQAKSIELLSLQAAAIEQQQQKSTIKSCLTTSRDRDCILYAREYLLQHMSNPPSLTELAAAAGTNTFKLKNGFKELFDQTVFGYLTTVRLEQARTMLGSGSSIKEVSAHLGYSSVQHFSTAFRKQFGISPGRL
jgi:AraC-like DNA-binding protein